MATKPKAASGGKRKRLTGIDRATKAMIRGPADELAARNGCRFDEARAAFAVEWIPEYCVLYQGANAGQPLTLHDWALEATRQMFGWVRWSDHWGQEVRRFREGDIFIPKKNGKSPTLAAWGLYLLVGDGEPGQQVHFGAKDGGQARDIVGQHAVKMVELSPALSAECRINRNECSIRHGPTNSVMKPATSSNERTQQSKEGINGSVLVDELHVVDRAFMTRVSRAGISRTEPFFIKVSTAGNTPDGYGKERFDYALMVQQGKVVDESLYVAIYAAPQDITEAEIDADPARVGRMANPAWGRLIDPDEFLKDYRTSRAQGLEKFREFMMYRLNVWQRAANPWLRTSDWEACRVEFTEDTLRGRRCFAGLDLSKTRDMSAIALAFPPTEDDPRVYLLVYFFLPEDIAREYAAVYPFESWGRSGHLILTPGGVTDYGFIRTEFRRLNDLFRIEGLHYDQTYAEQLTQQLSEGELDAAGRLLVDGLGIERIVFPQRITTFTGPTHDFERLVLSATLAHNGHPVLDWQAGHAKVVVDANKNKRPVKPTGNDDRRGIDGIVAGIMAVAGAVTKPTDPPSVYATRGLEVINGEEPAESEAETRDPEGGEGTHADGDAAESPSPAGDGWFDDD
jgi:phage terminase large subunit-like protein